MNSPRSRWLSLVVLSLAFVLTTASPAMAKDKEKKEPDRFIRHGVKAMEAETPWKQWLAALLMGGGIIAIAVKNPHRSHLD